MQNKRAFREGLIKMYDVVVPAVPPLLVPPAGKKPVFNANTSRFRLSRGIIIKRWLGNEWWVQEMPRFVCPPRRPSTRPHT